MWESAYITRMKSAAKINSTRDEREIAHFAETSAQWWDEHGPYAPLHRMTSARMRFLKQALGDVKGKAILDVGCGGGLMCEPLARLGAKVTGIDADAQAIATASAHAARQDLNITYINGAAEDLVQRGKTFDVVMGLEVVEHVSNPELFVEMLAQLVRPGGLVVMSTLNRTWKSYALGIIAAERVLRWVPAGTHDWQKFLKPSELARMAEQNHLAVQQLMGLVYRPLTGDFELAPHDLDVNYFLVASAPAKRVK